MPAVLSVTMAVGARKLAEKRAIVTHLAAMEELEGIDVLCFDKTGTLTQKKLTLDRALQLDRQRAVLVVTRYADMNCCLEAMQIGAVDCLANPLAPIIHRRCYRRLSPRDSHSGAEEVAWDKSTRSYCIWNREKGMSPTSKNPSQIVPMGMTPKKQMTVK